jgi:hypothetical protein
MTGRLALARDALPKLVDHAYASAEVKAVIAAYDEDYDRAAEQWQLAWGQAMTLSGLPQHVAWPSLVESFQT